MQDPPPVHPLREGNSDTGSDRDYLDLTMLHERRRVPRATWRMIPLVRKAQRRQVCTYSKLSGAQGRGGGADHTGVTQL